MERMMLILPRHGGRDGTVPAGNLVASPWMPLVLAAIPLFWSVGVFAVGHTPRPMAPAAPRPGLVFDQYLVDFGNVDATEELRAVFRFTNRGTTPVTITDWTPSCGCLKPQLRKLEYLPLESGDFFVRVQTANEMPGPREYTLAVKYDDGQSREANLTFRAVLPEDQVIIRPRALIVYQLGNQPRSEEIVIQDKRSQPLEILGYRLSTEMVQVELGPRGPDENGQMQSRVRVTIPGNIPAGRHQLLLTLHTNDAVYPELKVPLLIEGHTSAPQAVPPAPSRLR